MQLGYFWSFFCFYATVFFLSLGLTDCALGGNETDRLALLEFKARITDPLGVMSSWNDSINFCLWQGVTCSHRHQRVISLNLMSLQLAGSISPHIGNLSFLRELSLDNNSFSQEIPSEIGRLSKLQYLYLFNNSLSGGIPSNLSRCSNLIKFHVVNNQLVGEIPMEIGSLSKLTLFAVSGNNLTGAIPSSFGNLSSLESLAAGENYFIGSIPNALGKLTTLRKLFLHINTFSGTIPPSIYNLSFLTDLYLAGNPFYPGSLPSNLGISLPNLRHLGMFQAQLIGSIPPSLSNASNLEVIQLQLNSLTGQVPTFGNSLGLQLFSIEYNFLGNGGASDLNFLSSLTNATNLRVLVAGDNNFGGMLPELIGNFSTTLEIMQFNDNHMVGNIPAGLQNLINLIVFLAPGNHLSGNIPTVIGELKSIQILSLSFNELSGHIPSSVGNLTNLYEVSLANNNLQGDIPSSLGNCQNLQKLDFSYNNLSGSIPAQVIGLSSLSIYLDLSHNRLSSVLPLQVGNLKNLNVLNVSQNMLSGEIPSTLGSCVTLEFLFMQGNFFQGPIPSSLSSLRGLQELDISNNNLSGEIPEFLGDLIYLQVLNLSYNNFEGVVPVGGVFKNASRTSVIGNSRLCGGTPEFHLPGCNFKRSKGKLSLAWKIVISTLSGLLCVILVLSSYFLFLTRKKRNEPASDFAENLHLMVSYHSLSKATDGFSLANLIGAGSFGSVYKGILDQSGMAIAVKVFTLVRQGASRSFTAECEALRNIRHRNLIKILTVCSSVDYQGNDFKALVYEFMANGSLEEWLHQKPTTEETQETPRSLNLLQRLNVTIDVACALDYLHHQCETPIVHCDLKPSNVLLDHDMTGHVGDFGLARILSEATQDLPASGTSSVGVRGTVGYAAPEYGMGSEVSTDGDVYSYGILLLEMFTGKKPTNDIFKEGLNLHNFVRAALPDRMPEIVDPFLLREIVKWENGGAGGCRVRKSLVSILEIGVACSAELPHERRNISNVVAELQSIKNELLGARGHRTITFLGAKMLQLIFHNAWFILSDDQSNYTEEASPPPSSPFDFLKNLQGSQKGQNVKGVKELKEYLKRFGHLNHDQSSSNYLNTNNNNEGGGDGDDDFHEQTESAIRKFQLNYNSR
ncbi:probable LRR receptor-like serine/threonine-protein kinase At3g47570 [Hevea brasiliensis]|uniref:probable LRR receptor-like serine/threonine-protein kinase At3g47570 n=1 Tax=Hevea brasiliensis TaxID=3981 RepID=UPI0025DB6B96|nr:probable LRR receptor-like serine/threonine-protein kinase At3g47570 [Hevea brasiliensis]